MKTKRSAWTPSSDFDAVISSYEVITKQQTIAWVEPMAQRSAHADSIGADCPRRRWNTLHEDQEISLDA